MAGGNLTASAEAVQNGGKAMNLMKSGLTTGQTIAKIAAHAGAGGTLNVLQGGKFGQRQNETPTKRDTQASV